MAILIVVGCGDDNGAGTVVNDNDDTNDENHGIVPKAEACELACERVYTSTSDGGCQQVFRHDDNTPMSENDCVVECEEHDLMMGRQQCVAHEEVVDCKAQPYEMVQACQGYDPDEYHNRQEVCENACQRVYAATDDDGCQQSFSDGDGHSLSESECIDECQDEELLTGVASCIADDSQVQCKSEPEEMIDACGGTTGGETTVPHCEDVEPWDGQGTDFEHEVVKLVNELRAEGATCTGAGVEMPSTTPVEMDPYLRCASRLHSLNMADQNILAHELDGQDPTDRAREAGYSGWATENIAQGYPTPEDVVEGWLSSADGHCENMLDPNHNDIGVGYYNGWWTQKFG